MNQMFSRERQVILGKASILILCFIFVYMSRETSIRLQSVPNAQRQFLYSWLCDAKESDDVKVSGAQL